MKTRHNNDKYINRGGKQNGKMIEGTEVLALSFFLSFLLFLSFSLSVFKPNARGQGGLVRASSPS